MAGPAPSRSAADLARGGAGALLVIAALHVFPDAWSQARAAGIWPWAVPLAAAGAFLLTGLAARIGCTCSRDTRQVGGTSAAAALAVHRFLEGSAMVLIGSVTVVAALAVHALGEGLAVGALLRAHPRRRVGIWLAAMCASPVIGVLPPVPTLCRRRPGRCCWPSPGASSPRPPG
jgi:ZIP family zinc transporter